MRSSYFKRVRQTSSAAYWTKVWHDGANIKTESSAKCANEKHVHFSTVTIREYEIRPSDNPAVSSGPGIELGWHYTTLTKSTPLIPFDDFRIKQRKKYYQYSSGMTPLQRRVRLSEFGYSKEAIEEATIKAAILRRSNDKSVRSMRYDRISECNENIGRSWKQLKVKMGINKKPQTNKKLESVPIANAGLESTIADQTDDQTSIGNNSQPH